jgi:geranylgeranyl diphosphate synthase, type I
VLTAPPLARYRREVDQYLRSLITAQDPPLLYRMARYHLGWEDVDRGPLQAEGKGLRPYLCLLTCEALGGERQAGLPAAAAIELIHNFSLIHDDIQDRDVERHHRPTVWSVWGDAQAINAGDALLALARLALFRLEDAGVPASTVLEAARVLDERTLEMVEGQTMDLEFEQRLDVTLPEYLVMIERKAGALFDGALRLGALVAGAEDALARRLGAAGRALGIAFQIRDDMLGIWGDASETGKPAEDIRHGKKSLPVMYVLNEGPSAPRNEIEAVYRKTDLSEGDVQTVLSVLEIAGARDYCVKVAGSYKERALETLNALPLADDAKRELRETAEFLLERDF